MLPFVRTDPPRRLADHPVNRSGDWYRWSDEFRETLVGLDRLIPELPAPHLIDLHLARPYNYTYTVGRQLSFADLHRELMESAAALYRMKVTDRLWLFTGLTDVDISSRTVHYLFAYYQFCFALISGRPETAIYAPLGDLSETGFPFPLHADLYIQKILMIVFNNVPPDDSGKSLLLPVAEFRKVIDRLVTMPAAAKSYIKNLLAEEHSEDRFNEFFKTLYDRDAPWIEELLAALEPRQLSVKFIAGEGFLLHDRAWLHGRTAPSGGVFADRLHRLTFRTEVP